MNSSSAQKLLMAVLRYPAKNIFSGSSNIFSTQNYQLFFLYFIYLMFSEWKLSKKQNLRRSPVCHCHRLIDHTTNPPSGAPLRRGSVAQSRSTRQQPSCEVLLITDPAQLCNKTDWRKYFLFCCCYLCEILQNLNLHYINIR